MKKLLLLLSIVIAANSLFAQDFEYSGIWYTNLSDGTAEVAPDMSRAYTFESVTIPDTAYETIYPSIGDPYEVAHAVTSIGAGVFTNCNKLHNITLPKTLKYIQASAFTNCCNLEAIVLPEGLIRVYDEAFWKCASLKELIFPSTTDSIGVRNFGGMATDDDMPGSFFESQLRRVIIKAVAPPRINGTLSEIFDETGSFTSDSVNLFVQASAYDDYTASANYAVFHNIYPYGNGNVNILPTDKTDSVKITWFNFYGVEEYLVTVYKGEETIAQFSVTKDGTATRLLPPRRIEEENDSTKSSTEMFVVTLGSLEGATTYNYNVSGVNKQKETIFRTAGNFRIDGVEGIKQVQEEIVRVIHYTISVAANDDKMGTVSGGGRIEEGLETTLTATPNEHYRFIQWSDGNTDNPRSVTVTKDETYTAEFDEQIKYTVTFVGFGDKELKSEKVEIGYDATAPEAPAVEGYEFKGWDKDFENVQSDLTVNAIYEINTFTVIFVDWDDKELSKQTVDWGSAAQAPDDPKREGYKFIGWDKSFASVKSDLTVKAVYEILQFTVVFVDWDDKELSKQTVDWGCAAQAPDDPTREGHKFIGWDKSFSTVKSDLTVKAEYEINTYTVEFRDWDNKLLFTQSVAWGDKADTPKAPSREGYSFIGWDKDYSSVKEDMVITAQYSILTFTVVFYDWQGNKLSSQVINWHEAAKAPDAPIREGYTFTGWDNDFSDITKDLTVTAQYQINTYTVTFVDWDDKVLSTQKVNWNQGAVYPSDPSREGYKFTGWDKAFDKITSDLTVKAIYEILHYTVVFEDWDKTEISKQTVDWGKAAIAPADPKREGYTFIGWEPADFSQVKSDMTITAQYSKDAVVYTVTFVDYDDKVILAVKVLEGEDAKAPADPVREGYKFTGWDKTFDNVQSNLTVRAQYEINKYKVTVKAEHGEVSVSQDVDLDAVPWGTELTLTAAADKGYRFVKWSDGSTDNPHNITVKANATITAQFEEDLYMVTFIGFGGATIKFEYILAGESAHAPDLAEVNGWHFVKWDTDFSNVTSNITVTAVYEINVYSVVFVDWDGSELSKQTIEHGESAKAPADPTREGYTFTGWDNAFSNIESDLTVKAQYEILHFSVVFVDKDGNELSKQTVDWGTVATAPEAPIVEGYEFIGWDIDFSNVKSDLTVKAQYKEVEVPDYTPQNLKVVVEAIEDKDTKITFSWDAVEGAGSYEIQLLYNGLSLFTTNTYTLHEIPLILSALLEQITGLEPGTYQLDWQVRSLDAKGNAISDWADGEQFEIEVPILTGLENPGTHPSSDAAGQAVKLLRNGRLVIILPDGREYNTVGAMQK